MKIEKTFLFFLIAVDLIYRSYALNVRMNQKNFDVTRDLNAFLDFIQSWREKLDNLDSSLYSYKQSSSNNTVSNWNSSLNGRLVGSLNYSLEQSRIMLEKLVTDSENATATLHKKAKFEKFIDKKYNAKMVQRTKLGIKIVNRLL